MNLNDSPSGPASPSRSTPRIVGWLALAGVSLIAGIASWFHALAVVQAAGATPPVAYLVPALADLVILGASADLLAASRANQPRPPLAMLALGTGIAVTLAMNVVASHPHAMPAWLVDGWPAVAFVLALESLAGLVRRGRGDTMSPRAPAAHSQQQPGEPPTTAEALRVLLDTDSQRRIAGLLDVPRSRVQAWARTVAETPPSDGGRDDSSRSAVPAAPGQNGHHG